MSDILKFDFQKKKTIVTFFRRKLSKVHKKDTILHVTITFSLKQGQARTSSQPITLPLIIVQCPKDPTAYVRSLSALNLATVSIDGAL